MKRWTASLAVLALVLGLVPSPPSARACPACADAVAASGDGADDPLQESRAYNQSIYLFAGMPYLLLGVCGFMVYRGYRRNQQTGSSPAATTPAAEESSHVPSAQSPGVPE